MLNISCPCCNKIINMDLMTKKQRNKQVYLAIIVVDTLMKILKYDLVGYR